MSNSFGARIADAPLRRGETQRERRLQLLEYKEAVCAGARSITFALEKLNVELSSYNINYKIWGAQASESKISLVCKTVHLDSKFRVTGRAS